MYSLDALAYITIHNIHYAPFACHRLFIAQTSFLHQPVFKEKTLCYVANFTKYFNIIPRTDGKIAITEYKMPRFIFQKSFITRYRLFNTPFLPQTPQKNADFDQIWETHAPPHPKNKANFHQTETTAQFY